MRAKRWVVGSSLVLGIWACSSGSAPNSPYVNLPPKSGAAPVAPSANALVYFDGAVDAKQGIMKLVVRSPTGEIKSQATLPYGNAAGDVYFHTCSAAYSTGTHQLSGSVQAVNLMAGSVTSMNAVIDSVSVTGVTLASGPGAGSASGVIASYGTVAPNTANCGSAMQPWVFQNLPGDPSFTFKGHADGTASGGGGSGVTYTGSFTTASAEAPAQAIADFATFRSALTGTYTSITLSGSKEPAGRTCTGASATSLCAAIHAGTNFGPVTCNGTTWHVDFTQCCAPQVISDEQPGGGCTCSDLDVVRVGAGCWFGGLAGTSSCSQPDQTITIHCQ